MNEVSSEKTLGLLVNLLKKEDIDPDALFRGLPVDQTRALKSGTRIDWDVFVQIMDRFKDLVGEEGLIRAGTLIVSEEDQNYLGGMKFVARLMRLFASPSRIYSIITKLAGPDAFHGLKFFYEQITETEHRIQIEIPEDRTFNEGVLLVYIGIFTTLPMLIGLERAVVDYRLDGRTGNYRIFSPASATLFHRMRNAVGVLMGARGLIGTISTYQREAEAAHRLASESHKSLGISAQLATTSRLSALGEMAGGVAHEINNPLAILMGRLEKVKFMISEKADGESLLRDLEKALTAGKRIEAIVRSLMTLTDRDVQGSSHTRLSQIATDMKNLFETRLEAGKIRLEIEQFGDQVLACNDSQVEQILSNLFSNSIQVLPEGGWIRLSAQTLNKGLLEIAIEDSGPGIPQQIKDRIFDPFFTTREIGKGSGLGLTLARSIAERLGGSLVLDEDAPHTRFFLRLPLAGSEASLALDHKST